MTDSQSAQPQQTYFNPYASSHTQSIVQMTSTHDEIEELKRSFQMVEVVDGKVISYGKPLMNELGINSVIGQLKSLVHRITIMSNLDEKEISKLMLTWSDALILDLMFNRLNYGITNSYDRTKIVRMSQAVAFTCIKRAIYGDDKKMWSKIQHEMTNTIIQPGQQGQPWYKRWSPFK